MPVSLTKIVDGKPSIADNLTSEQVVNCPRCGQTYRLGYSDGEWHRVKDWLARADRAIREDHKRGHEALSLEISWKAVRR